MKAVINLLIAIALVHTTQAAVLLRSSQRDPGSPAPRNLVVYPGYNEIQATNKYKDSLKAMLERVRNLHHNLELFNQETQREVANIVEKINAETEKDAYDSLLNDMFFEKLNKVKTAA